MNPEAWAARGPGQVRKRERTLPPTPRRRQCPQSGRSHPREGPWRGSLPPCPWVEVHLGLAASVQEGLCVFLESVVSGIRGRCLRCDPCLRWGLCARQRGWPGRLFLEWSPSHYRLRVASPGSGWVCLPVLGVQEKVALLAASAEEGLRWHRSASGDSGKCRNGQPEVEKGEGVSYQHRMGGALGSCVLSTQRGLFSSHVVTALRGTSYGDPMKWVVLSSLM